MSEIINNKANTIALIAEKLSASNSVVTFKSNSVFESIEQMNSSEYNTSLVRTLAEKLNNELILLKGKLKPLTDEIVELFEKEIVSKVTPSELAEYNIIPFNYPVQISELLNMKLITSEFNPELKIGPSEIYIKLPEDMVNFKEMFKHSNSMVNAHISSILDKYSIEELADIWSKYLTNISDTNIAISDLGFNLYKDGDILMLLFCLLDYLILNRPVGVEVDDDRYNEIMLSYRRYIVNKIALYYNRMETANRMKRVIVAKEGKTAYVAKEHYNTFLEEGGVPDVILGIISSGNNDVYTLNDLKENAVTYANAWSNKVKVDKYQAVDNEINKHKVGYVILTHKIYNELIPEDLKSLLNTHNDAMEKLKAALTTMDKADLLDIVYVSRYIVGMCLFPTTNYYLFMTNMLDYCKLNPDLTPNEAATFASIDIVVDYLLNQINMENINALNNF